MTNKLAININFDSIGEALGYPPGYKDPSFFKVFDRLISISQKKGIPLSLFVIGRDLEDKDIAARVRELSIDGFEIGNHTYSHNMNLGKQSSKEIIKEINSTHELITQITGLEPKGFIAPAWSTSEEVRNCIIDLNYLYDSSLFSSIYLYPMIFKIGMNHIKDKKRFLKIISRKDWLFPLTRPTKPYFAGRNYHKAKKNEKSILVLPVPTLNRYSLPLWHTTGFITGWAKHFERLKKIEKKNPNLLSYYLLHPADFASDNDILINYSHSLARMNIPIESKLNAIENVFDFLINIGKEFVTMSELAKEISLSIK